MSERTQAIKKTMYWQLYQATILNSENKFMVSGKCTCPDNTLDQILSDLGMSNMGSCREMVKWLKVNVRHTSVIVS